jgi:hypothetical protein
VNTPEIIFIAITCKDGSLAVMQFVTRQQPYGDDPGWIREANTDEISAEITAAGIEADTWRVIDFEDLPTDRSFRNAWHDPDGKGPIQIDMERARDLHRDRLRQERVSLLADLDVAYMRADEADDAAAKRQITMRKQQLRDITVHPAIRQAGSPGELAEAGLDVLNGGA